MNAEQLRKNVGQLLRVRPLPFLVDDTILSSPRLFTLTSDGPRREKPGQDTDFDWRLEEVTASTLKLFCPFTGHKVTLGADNVREYRSPNFLMLKCQLILEEGVEVRIEPI